MAPSQIDPILLYIHMAGQVTAILSAMKTAVIWLTNWDKAVAMMHATMQHADGTTKNVESATVAVMRIC